MKKMVLRWVGLAVFLSLMALLSVKLGEWQLDRLDQRRDQNATVVANEQQPPVPYTEIMTGEIPDDDQWRKVLVTGEYTGEQFQVRYRNHDGSPGIEVVAVMQTNQGDELLIDRGFLAREQGKPDPDVLPSPPTGEVSILGHIHRDERGDDTATVPHAYKVRLINSAAMGEFLGRDLLAGYVQLISSTPAEDGQLTPVTPPEQTEGNHFSYALQWFTFGIIALVGIVVLIRADLKDHRKAKEKAERQRARAAADAAD